MTDRAVLLSITPEFAEKIAAGTKTVELRRRFPEVPVGTWVYLYVTLPVGAIGGRARVAEIDVDEPSTLWKRHRSQVGLPRNRFNAYFADRQKGFAVRLEGYQAFTSLDLAGLRRVLEGFVAPQSYRFLDEDAQRLLLAQADP